MHVPLLDLRLQYQKLRDQIRAEFDAIADAQAFILGPKVEQFEREIEAYCGANHAIGASSGTDAELLALMALEIGPGDAVILPAYTFFATAGGVARVGARPVFVDIDPLTFNMDVHALEVALEKTRNVKAIIPVHLFGCCADMERIMKLSERFRVPVIEDAAQALGAEQPHGAAGAIGEFGWFSFYPTKNLGAFGDAGMVTCRDKEMAAKLRALRNHGMLERYRHKWVGGNFRLDALQAAILSVKLPHLDDWAAARRRHAAEYREAFIENDLGEILTMPSEPWAMSGLKNHHVYNQFVIRTPRRDALRQFLMEHGVGTEIYYPVPLHLQECFASLGYREGDFPEAEKAARETLALPMYPELTRDQIQFVAELVRKFFL